MTMTKRKQIRSHFGGKVLVEISNQLLKEIPDKRMDEIHRQLWGKLSVNSHVIGNLFRQIREGIDYD